MWEEVMTDRDLTRAEVEAFMKMRDMQPSHYKMGRQLLRCMDERDAAREALMNAGIALHVAKREAEAAEAENARLREALSALPRKVAETTVDDGPSWPDDRPGVWVAGLDACENVVRREVEAILKGDQP
jgi:hypothetical protein